MAYAEKQPYLEYNSERNAVKRGEAEIKGHDSHLTGTHIYEKHNRAFIRNGELIQSKNLEIGSGGPPRLIIQPNGDGLKYDPSTGQYIQVF